MADRPRKTDNNGRSTTREAFAFSRRLEFFSEDELTKQINQPRQLWHLVVAKEAIDNSLDHCEEIGRLPHISVRFDADGISITDNGDGILPEVVPGILNLDQRVSSRHAFRCPTRGCQGNAGKCLVGVPFVLGGNRGRLTIHSRGLEHDITVRLDQIARQPIIEHERRPADVHSGTILKVALPGLSSKLDHEEIDRIVRFMRAYALLNPHANFSLDVTGQHFSWPRSIDRCRKWSAARPDPPAWHDDDSFEGLVTACLQRDRETGQDRPFTAFLRILRRDEAFGHGEGGLRWPGHDQASAVGTRELRRAGPCKDASPPA